MQPLKIPTAQRISCPRKFTARYGLLLAAYGISGQHQHRILMLLDDKRERLKAGTVVSSVKLPALPSLREPSEAARRDLSRPRWQSGWQMPHTYSACIVVVALLAQNVCSCPRTRYPPPWPNSCINAAPRDLTSPRLRAQLSDDVQVSLHHYTD